MKKKFEEFMSNLRTTIEGIEDITDFSKAGLVDEQTEKYLHFFESLKEGGNSKQKLKRIIMENPQCLLLIPELLGKRSTRISVLHKGHEETYDFANLNKTFDEYVDFINDSGLLNAIRNTDSLIDLIRGIEIGLDSNARKNRTGKKMEDIVENYLQQAGLILGTTYFKQMNKSEIEKRFNIDLGEISNAGKTEKRFDYVVYINSIIYAIEVNFYSTSGSKLNETARSYKNIALESKNIEGFRFIWITDGIGWTSARHNLEETWDSMELIFNLNDLENGAFKKLFSNNKK